MGFWLLFFCKNESRAMFVSLVSVLFAFSVFHEQRKLRREMEEIRLAMEEMWTWVESHEDSFGRLRDVSARFQDHISSLEHKD